MQVFLPWPSFEESARALDKLRLQKQVVEAYQLTRAATGSTRGWRSHPVTRMWCAHLDALTQYAEACTSVWNERGGTGQRVMSLIRRELEECAGSLSLLPGLPWFTGFAPFHLSHQLNLVRKQPKWYVKSLGLDGVVTHHETLTEPYLWPLDDNALQAGPRGTGRPWQEEFDTPCQADGTLIVTRAAAAARYERRFPVIMQRLSLRDRAGCLH
jgi:Pyrimidine dimer DNA glycosylase